MNLRTLFAAAAIALAAPAALAQKTPEAIVARFVELANAGQLTTPDGQAILTGEAKQMATDAKSNLPAPDKIIGVSPTAAAVRFVLHGNGSEEADAYFYLEKTSAGWAISAYRAMALSGMDQMLLAEMKKRPRLSPEDQLQKLNLELVLSTDSQLRAWFTPNREKLAALTGSSAAGDLKALGVSRIEQTNDETRITIGGTLENTVGILKAGPSGPPKIDLSSYIWIEDLGSGWFLFRTT